MLVRMLTVDTVHSGTGYRNNRTITLGIHVHGRGYSELICRVLPIVLDGYLAVAQCAGGPVGGSLGQVFSKRLKR
jgi:hypothetical protein